jgi:hypothetical protein
MTLVSRPRRAPWIEEELDEADKPVLHNPRIGKRIVLNPSSLLIWQLCDGSKSGEQLVELINRAFPDAVDVEKDVTQTLTGFIEAGLLVMDGGNAALEYQGEVVRTIVPNVELLWHLEKIRLFLFGVMRLDRVDGIDSDVEQLLNAQALERAKNEDADSARQLMDSSVISYKGAMRSASFNSCIESIKEELHLALPEVESEIGLSGNAVYLSGSHMGWHSNHSRSDGRIYCSWADEDEANFFRYEHPITGEVITSWEQPGWNIKSFTIPEKPARFWHCIGAKSLRLSLGFRYDLPQ